MTDKRDTEDDRAALAAEHALRLLTGEDRRYARELESIDPAFAEEVGRWRGRTAPLFGDVESVAPAAELWGRIERMTGREADGSNVVVLRRRVGFWRATTGAMTALAAALALVLVLQPGAVSPPPQPRVASAPLVAMLGDQQQQMKVVASWDPDAQQLVLAVAGGMPADPRHSHELWVIPAGGKPRSLGTMGTARQTHMKLANALADLLQQGATIAISVEPPGGSPTGSPTGPVVASGALNGA
jgi:anti-sigma-K factor RskA